MAHIPTPPSLIIFDFDGVFTDNKVYVDEKGIESVCCSRADGLGISMLRAKGIPMIILSTEQNSVVKARANKLHLSVFQDCADKKTFLQIYSKNNNVDLSKAIYVGNDINDLEAMQLVGCSVCPADAHHKVKAKATFTLTLNGGQGAVRELSEIILNAVL